MKYSIAENTRKSGRADGNVYMRNHRIRGFAMPANAQTPAQMLQRGNFGSFSSGWNDLDDDQRLAWNEFSVPAIDNMGHDYNVSGKDAYVMINRNLFNTDNAPISDAPIPSSTASPTSLIISSANSATLEIDFTPTPIPSGVTWLVYATKTFSAGTYKPGKSQFKLLVALPATTVAPQDVITEYTAVFGAPVAGGSIFVRIVAIRNSTGLAAPAVTARSLVS